MRDLLHKSRFSASARDSSGPLSTCTLSDRSRLHDLYVSPFAYASIKCRRNVDIRSTQSPFLSLFTADEPSQILSQNWIMIFLCPSNCSLEISDGTRSVCSYETGYCFNSKYCCP